jgi:hypothetical protein
MEKEPSVAQLLLEGQIGWRAVLGAVGAFDRAKSLAIGCLLSCMVVAPGMLALGCGGSPTFTPTISQGLYGRIVLYKGNCMPGARGCKTSHPSRKVLIREPVTDEQMSVTYLVRPRGLVATATADRYGFYEVSLAPGTYSVFVEDDGREYCNSFGGRGEACQVTIGDGLTERELKIDHAAW